MFCRKIFTHLVVKNLLIIFHKTSFTYAFIFPHCDANDFFHSVADVEGISAFYAMVSIQTAEVLMRFGEDKLNSFISTKCLLIISFFI